MHRKSIETWVENNDCYFKCSKYSHFIFGQQFLLHSTRSEKERLFFCFLSSSDEDEISHKRESVSSRKRGTLSHPCVLHLWLRGFQEIAHVSLHQLMQREQRRAEGVFPETK